MTRELLVLRHGKAEKPMGGGDFEREITDPGKRGAQRIGVWLLGNQLLPDHVVSSPAERAIETARKCCKAMGMGAQGIVEDQRIYQASKRDLLDVLGAVPAKAKRVLLVGHNPSLEALVSHLGGILTGLTTAALARIEMPDGWSRMKKGAGRIISVTDPKSLPKKFPFPGPGSDDLRDRPAYYYTQSSVIPYRLNKGKPEVLIIQSSKKKHFVVPKGIKDPGATDQESAAKEAWEEAGVEGKVGADPLGSYVYDKWGAECTCYVYAMEVTRVLPDDEWHESHRGRQWVTPEDAAANLKQSELGPMVLALTESLKGG